MLVLYWLSKHGFECASVDHTGIDLIVRNPHSGEVMGISVKSRTRNKGTERESVTIPAGDFGKMRDACKAFECQPYFAIVVDAKDVIQVFIASKSHLLKLAPKRCNSYWRMTATNLQRYANDPEVMAFELRTETKRWWT